MHWVLILFIHASTLSKDDSVALTTIPGFTTEDSCIEAGKTANDLTAWTLKQEKFVCIQQG